MLLLSLCRAKHGAFFQGYILVMLTSEISPQILLFFFFSPKRNHPAGVPWGYLQFCNIKIFPYSLSSLFAVLSSHCNLIYSGCHCSVLVESGTVCYSLLVQRDCLAPTNNAWQGEGIPILVEGTTEIDFLLEKQDFSLQKLLETLHKAKINQNQTLFFFQCFTIAFEKHCNAAFIFVP